jgi:hypothetical protein
VAIRKQNYKFVTNCYIINLAITDLLFLLISVPLTAYLGFTNTWILSGLINCRIQMVIAHVRFSFQLRENKCRFSSSLFSTFLASDIEKVVIR